MRFAQCPTLCRRHRFLGARGRRAVSGAMAQLARQGLQARVALRDLQAHLGLPGLLALRDRQVRQAARVRKVLPDRPDLTGRLALREIPGTPDQSVPRDRTEQRAAMEVTAMPPRTATTNVSRAFTFNNGLRLFITAAPFLHDPACGSCNTLCCPEAVGNPAAGAAGATGLRRRTRRIRAEWSEWTAGAAGAAGATGTTRAAGTPSATGTTGTFSTGAAGADRTTRTSGTTGATGT